MGLAPGLPLLLLPLDHIGLHPAQTERIAGVPPHEGRGPWLTTSADRKLPALSEQQICAAGLAWSDSRPGRGLVHRSVLRALLPDHHAEVGLHHHLSFDRSVADYRYPLLYLLRVVFRPDWATEDHHGGLPDRGSHLFSALPCADALRQSGVRAVSAVHPPFGGCERLQFPYLCAAYHEFHGFRSGPGCPDQGRPFLPILASGCRPDRGDT